MHVGTCHRWVWCKMNTSIAGDYSFVGVLYNGEIESSKLKKGLEVVLSKRYQCNKNGWQKAETGSVPFSMCA